jgi:hypothetical protein
MTNKLLMNGISTSGTPYLAHSEKKEFVQADKTQNEILLDICITVPPEAKPDPGDQIAIRNVSAGERVVATKCPANGSDCLDTLRRILRSRLPNVLPKTIESWPWRLTTSNTASTDRDVIVNELVSYQSVPIVYQPIVLERKGEIDVDDQKNAKNANGNPILRPIRSVPKGAISLSSYEPPNWRIAAINVPTDSLAQLGPGQ